MIVPFEGMGNACNQIFQNGRDKTISFVPLLILNIKLYLYIQLEGKYKCVSEKVAKAETAFIKTKRHFATMLDYYKIPSSFSLRFKNFENNATKLTGLKIEYESLQYLQNSQ